MMKVLQKILVLFAAAAAVASSGEAPLLLAVASRGAQQAAVSSPVGEGQLLAVGLSSGAQANEAVVGPVSSPAGPASEPWPAVRSGGQAEAAVRPPPQRQLLPANDPAAWPPAAHAVVAAKQQEGCGGGCYRSIQQAIDDAPPEEDSMYVVHVLAGVYDETVNITRRNVMLIGDGVGLTVITGNKSNATGVPMNMTATVNAMAHGFVAQDLTIRNTAGTDGRQAVALRSNSHMSLVYRCSLEGYEDTLYAENGHQFYLDSSIWGTVDFVFGNAQAMFQNCSLLVRRPPEGKHNVISAQGCNNASRESGFAFHMCHVDAAPSVDLTGVDTFLGRPYRNFSHVAFIRSSLGGVVNPSGWVSWDRNKVIKETTETVVYREYGNVGPGASVRGVGGASVASLMT